MVEPIEKKVPERKTGHSFLLNGSTNFGSLGHQADGETKQTLVERRFTQHGGVTMRYDRGDRRVTVQRSLD